MPDGLPPFPNVEIAGLIGRGGFGRVYRGRHRALGIDVAVKLIDAADPAAGDVRQLLGEAQLMARLDHPNLLRVFDAGAVNQAIYLVLEFMDAGSCAGLRRLPPADASTLAHQVLSGMQALHDARILHRDIKPANCLRRADGRVKLGDLGLALDMRSRAAAASDAAGTLPFMAPELFAAPPRYSVASDLYAFGMTMASLVLDEPPYPAGPLPELLPWILDGRRPDVGAARADLPAAFSRTLTRLIAPRVEDRPASAADALTAIAAEASAPLADAAPTVRLDRAVVGPWIVGDVVYASGNWDGWAVTHRHTGAAARLMRVAAGSALHGISALVLRAADRAAAFDDRLFVPVLDWGTWDDRVYVVTAAAGRALDDVVAARGPLDEAAALAFTADLASAVAYLHERGLVYQNLDPGAAVIAHDARRAQLAWPIYCVDRGTAAAQRVLVPRFAAPEAFDRTTTIEPPVDVFGLGAVLLFLMTGQSPPRDGGPVAASVRLLASGITAPTAALIAALLDPAAGRRPTATEAQARTRQILQRLGGGRAERHPDFG